MYKSFFTMIFSDKRLLGLDIGSNSLKMVEIKHSNSKKELVTYAVAKHDINLEGYWDSGKIQQFADIINLIKKNTNFTTSKTVVALQSKHVFVSTMDFELGWNKRMIQEEINRQSKFFLPYPPDEMRLSWNVIQSNSKIATLTGKQRVVINAIPNFVIENITNLLNKCNLEGVALENQTVSLTRSLLNEPKKSTILVDLGHDSTTYSIIIENVLRNSFTSAVGLKRLDETLQNSLGVSTVVAETFKKDLSLVNLFELPKEINDHLSLIKSELKNFYDQNTKIAQMPDQVIITGGGIHTVGLKEFLKDFPVPIKYGDYSIELSMDENKKRAFAPLSSSLSSAVGLALRDDV
jgi:type IV pilus assembly protein PilM